MVQLKKKKRITKEEQLAVKEEKRLSKEGIQDQFQAKGFEFVTWSQDNPKVILSVLGGIFAMCLIVVLYGSYSEKKELKASFAYEEALSPLGLQENTDKKELTQDQKTENTEQVLNNLSVVWKQYKGNKIAVWAKIRAASLSQDIEKVQDTIKLYESLQSTVGKDQLIYPLIVIALAGSYEKTNNNAKALKMLDDNYSYLQSFAEEVLWQSTLIAADMNDNKRALSYANKLLNEFPSSKLLSKAKALKESLS